METARPALERAVTTRILIGEDQPHVAEALRLLLKGVGYQAVLADSPGGVLACLAAPGLHAGPDDDPATRIIGAAIVEGGAYGKLAYLTDR